MNRAIARRTFFETRQDFRFFLARLASEVRHGALELHAFCLLGTHYHLLLRCLVGSLGESMQRVQLAYSRWFNRSRGRDGSLVRGRYLSKPVRSLAYRRMLVRYIDDNPRSAGLAHEPAGYPWGSASHYARTGGPVWLERGWVESEVRARASSSLYRPEDYARAFPCGEGLSDLVEARLRHGGGEDALDDLVRASSAGMRQWMRNRALLADGTLPGLPILSIRFLVEALTEGPGPSAVVWRDGVQRAAAEVVLVGLGRELCGQRLADLAERMRASETTVGRLHRVHRLELAAGGKYAEMVAEIARSALALMRGN
jgi:hypothetical protein